MTYREAVNYIDSLLRFGIKPGLERISALCRAAGDPQKKLRFLHVAGTNGKGSTCAYLASIYRAAGYRTGLFTSPYVVNFRERFQINGEFIAEQRLANLTERLRPLADAMAESPTEFEFITALAFLYFLEEQCDVVVLEVGLGGRFDSTNVIDTPLCSVITSIGLDHTAVLGDTIAQIAFEKAGILKPGGAAVMSACVPGAARAVIRQRAAECGAQVVVPDAPCGYPLLMDGAFQPDNAAAAMAAVQLVNRSCPALFVPDAALRYGVMHASLPARCEFLQTAPCAVLLDGAHNPDGVAVLADVIRARLRPRPTMVIGMMADKDCAAAAARLAPLCGRILAVPVSNPRALPPSELAALCRPYCADTAAVQTASAGIDAAFSDDADKVFCGSFYLAGEIRQELIEKLKK